MSRFLKGQAVTIALITLTLLGCTDTPPTGADGSPTDVDLSLIPSSTTSQRLAAQLRRDPDVIALQAIREEMTTRAVAARVSGAEAKKLLERDPVELGRRLGYASSELNSINMRMKTAKRNLLARYPELLEVARGMECSSDPAMLSRVLDYRGRPFEASLLSVLAVVPGLSFLRQEEPDVGDASCQWIQYTACLVVCTSAGPVIYWPCAFLCVCAFCEGGLASLCGPE